MSFLSGFEPLHITFFIYIFLMLGIGFYAYQATANLSDYILGGRRLGSFVTALSAGASDMSGWLLMGLPGAIYLSGLSTSWIAIGLSIGAYLNWLLVAGRLRIFTEYTGDALTLPDYFHSRFDDRSRALKIISATVILFFFVIYCASGVVASAKLFESTFNMPYSRALWVGAFATIAYVFIGGFLAVSWTDTVQASLMIFALLLVPLVVIFKVGEGNFEITTAVNLIRNVDPTYLNMTQGLSVIAIISSIAWGLGYFGQPHILVRFMAAESVKSIPNARRISITWMVLCLGGAVAVGFFGIAYFAKYPSESAQLLEGGGAEAIFLELAKTLLNPWVAGIVLSAVLAAVMSTLSCQLLVASSALTEDLYKGFLRKNASEVELVWIGRLMVFVVAMIAIYIAHDPDSRVLDLVSYAWAGFGAAFGPIILFSLFWPKITRNGALYGMIVGALTVIIYPKIPELLTLFNVTTNTPDQLRELYPLLELYEILPGFLLSSLTIILVSSLDRENPKLLQTFTAVEKRYYEAR